MKKILKLISIVLITIVVLQVTNLTAVNDSQEVYVFPYGSDTPITHLNTTERVMMPTEYQYEVSQMRGVWVATIWNLDFPRSSSVENFKLNYLKVLDNLQSYNVNTIFFQVRPCNDAFYNSSLNPYSAYLSGVQGKGLEDFDPLEWMVEETHKRHMEFQCWLNAYRVTPGGLFENGFPSSSEVKSTVESVLANLASNNFAKINKDCVLLGQEDTKLILDPGNPKVIKFIIDSVEEIIKNYDVDGVHFDDYFYLSGGFHELYSDQNTYETYRLSSLQTIREFREMSVNNLIKGVSDAVRKHNEETGSDVEYGAKPAAVWQSSSKYCSSSSGRNVPSGSNTDCGAYSSKYDLYADSKKWVEEGWVDYIAPQIYFNFENREVPYADIVDWWAETVQNANIKLESEGKKTVKLYIAHGTYRYNTTSSENQTLAKQFRKSSEIVNQLKYNQKYDVIVGSALYDYTSLVNFSGGIVHEKGMSNLKETWSKPSLIPGSGDECSLKASDYYISKRTNESLLKIVMPDDAYAFIVYKNSSLDAIIYNGDEYNYQLYDGNTYSIRAVDKKYNISSEETQIALTNTKENVAPNIVKITLDKNSYQIREYMKVSFPFSIDNDNDKLEYKAYFVNDGVEKELTLVKTTLGYEATSFVSGIGTYASYFKIVISDGDKEVECYSPYIYINPVDVIINKIVSKGKEKATDIFK